MHESLWHRIIFSGTLSGLDKYIFFAWNGHYNILCTRNWLNSKYMVHNIPRKNILLSCGLWTSLNDCFFSCLQKKGKHSIMLYYLFVQSIISNLICIDYFSTCLLFKERKGGKPLFCNIAQENSYSISHLLSIMTTKLLDSDTVVTVENCRQHGNYTVDELCSNCAVGS